MADAAEGKPDMGATETIDRAFRDHQRLLWAIAYRMTGVAADADEIVSETFTRAIEKPPPRADMPWKPWLVKVAMNLARDRLRRRKRRAYVGPWLPSPVESDRERHGDEPLLVEPAATAGRYDLLESASMAFLLALEALAPRQRAVLLLRDVFDYSVREAAAALDISEANVKTTLHRARRAMAAYDEDRVPLGEEHDARVRDVVTRFMTLLTRGDVDAIEAMLREDAVSLSDGGGVYNAARKPIVGRAAVARAYVQLVRAFGMPTTMDLRHVNGAPAIVFALAPKKPRDPPGGVMLLDVDARGLVRGVHSVMAPDKLTAIDFD